MLEWEDLTALDYPHSASLEEDNYQEALRTFKKAFPEWKNFTGNRLTSYWNWMKRYAGTSYIYE